MSFTHFFKINGFNLLELQLFYHLWYFRSKQVTLQFKELHVRRFYTGIFRLRRIYEPIKIGFLYT